ncbi:MAG TPA: hypothetical protein VIM65_22795 [Cyclobacteriaceae bacterium]
MERLVANFKSKKNYLLVKRLVASLGEEVEGKRNELEAIKKQRKRKFKSEDEFKALGGIAKGQLVSKAHLRKASWKKRA